MQTEILSKLGLNNNEIQIYLLLLKKGPSKASEIAELTKLHRTHVYDLLESMAKKAIVSFLIQENKKYFQAVSPAKLEVLLSKKQEQIQQDKKQLNTLIKELNQLTTESKTKLLASVFLGKQAFMSQLNGLLRILKKGEEYLVIGFTQKADETLQYFLPAFALRRIKKQVKRKIIMDSSLRGTAQTKQKFQQTRYLPKNHQIPMGIIVYKNKVILVIIEHDYISLKIENQKISDNFRKYFNLIWNQSEK